MRTVTFEQLRFELCLCWINGTRAELNNRIRPSEANLHRVTENGRRCGLELNAERSRLSEAEECGVKFNRPVVLRRI